MKHIAEQLELKFPLSHAEKDKLIKALMGTIQGAIYIEDLPSQRILMSEMIAKAKALGYS